MYHVRADFIVLSLCPLWVPGGRCCGYALLLKKNHPQMKVKTQIYSSLSWLCELPGLSYVVPAWSLSCGPMAGAAGGIGSWRMHAKRQEVGDAGPSITSAICFWS